MIRVFEPKLNLGDYFSVLSTLYKNNISGSSPIVSQFEQKLSNEIKSIEKNLFFTREDQGLELFGQCSECRDSF